MPTPKRRAPTSAELEAAAEFRRLLEACNRPQDEIAREIGVTQGAVWQWADGKIPISAKRAKAAAAAVGGDPARISVAWRELHAESEESTARLSTGLPPAAAQPLRPDFERMAAAVFLLREYLALTRFDPELLHDPRMLEMAYEGIELLGASEDASNVIDFTKYLNRRVEEQGGIRSFETGTTRQGSR